MVRKVRTKVHFYKPKTLELRRNPKFMRKSAPHLPRMDKYKIIKRPVTSESAMKQIEDHNTLTFIVDLRANKYQIAQAIKDLYEVSAAKVNTLIR